MRAEQTLENALRNLPRRRRPLWVVLFALAVLAGATIGWSAAAGFGERDDDEAGAFRTP